jgi:hypothetical protein
MNQIQTAKICLRTTMVKTLNWDFFAPPDAAGKWVNPKKQVL